MSSSSFIIVSRIFQRGQRRSLESGTINRQNMLQEQLVFPRTKYQEKGGLTEQKTLITILTPLWQPAQWKYSLSPAVSEGLSGETNSLPRQPNAMELCHLLK